jgi:hypothetical protein
MTLLALVTDPTRVARCLRAISDGRCVLRGGRFFGTPSRLMDDAMLRFQVKDDPRRGAYIFRPIAACSPVLLPSRHRDKVE